jgi:hypothetical protein
MQLTTKLSAQPIAYGAVLDDASLQAVMHTTGASAADVGRMLLSRYADTAIDFAGLDLQRPRSVRAWVRDTWAWVWASHACPGCLAQNPNVWLLAWKLPWTFVCTKHNTYLLDSCPRCGARLQSNVLDARQASQCCGTPPDTALGPNRRGEPRARRSHHAICGVQVAELDALPATAADVILQKRIDALLHADSAHQVQARDTLDTIRSLTQMVRYLGNAHLANGAPDAIVENWRQHIHQRDPATRPPGKGGRPLYRTLRVSPANPLVARTLISTAWDLYTAETDAPWLTFAGYDTPNPIQRDAWTQLLKFWTPPDMFVGRLNRIRDRGKFTVAAALDGRATHATAQWPSLRSDHVPQLLGPDVTASLFDDDFGRRAFSTRAFAALSLARLLHPGLSTWSAAAAALHLPTTVTAQCYRLHSQVGQQDRGASFGDRLAALAERLEGDAPPVDYGQRRRALAGLNLLEEEWATICRDSHFAADHPQYVNWSRYAAAWLWEHLTGGDWHHAPALELQLLDVPARQVRSNAYVRYWCANHVDTFRPALVNHGDDLLARAGLPPRGKVEWLLE